MSGISLERLEFDPSDAADSPNVGAYVRSSDGTLITHTTDGGSERLDVSADLAGLSNPSEFGIYAEDSTHGSGALGQFIVAVRNDSQGSLVDTDGDYSPLQVDSVGRLRTVTDLDLVGDLVDDGSTDIEDPLKVGGHAYDQASALGAIDSGDKGNLAMDLYRRTFINDAPNIGLQTSVTALTDVAAEMASTPLAGRTRVIIQNQGNDPFFVGASGVTATTGIEIGKGDSLSMELGEAVNIYAICDTGKTSSARVLEWG